MAETTRATTDARPAAAPAPARAGETDTQSCCGRGESGRAFLRVRNATREIGVVDERPERD
jgi:hypothetical protein